MDLEKFIEPGSDEFAEEKTAAEITERCICSHHSAAAHSKVLSREFNLSRELQNLSSRFVRSRVWPDKTGDGWPEWLASLGRIQRALFHALPDHLVFFEATSTKDERLHHTTGHWKLQFEDGEVVELRPVEQQTAVASEPFFHDVTEAAFKNISTVHAQLSKGIPYWRSRLDPATGIDLYGSNGIAVGDVDGDGLDEIYVCQPGGIPNRLLKFQHDGTVSGPFRTMERSDAGRYFLSPFFGSSKFRKARSGGIAERRPGATGE